MGLQRLIYVSRMRPGTDLDELVAQALRNNGALEITGALTVLDGTFFQYLEGPEAGVSELFTRIQSDPRHAGLRLLERRDIAKRMFEGWRMVMLHWNEDMRNVFHSFSPGAPLDLYQMDPSTAAPLFRAWLALIDGRAAADKP